MKHWLLIIILMLPIFASSQDKKIEKEEDIDREEMPERAQEFLLLNIPEDIYKLRHYFETDGEKESYEAKFKFNRHRFSVEFDEDGILEDIEVQVKKKDLKNEILKKIEHYLDTKHDRFKIEKIQAQYLSNKEDPELTMKRAKKFDSNFPDHFELIVATKNKGKLKKYEMLFDAKGNFKNEREIIRNSYDYLIF
ncbi:hypothetical protein ML462_06010 [Gramella lutea]|uniref:Uncharacterized protein n=1 Tax=Christiangramia lutea TaxID=1607951 RepID=A0A9X1V249_9FLAO|nr:hypothetical protein [Christiangramia lutea]MCH4822724.1 hypothetical protein [Christiangramia lutea]